jgi:23S rRNA (cytosine1962-C5)-methyltransferase
MDPKLLSAADATYVGEKGKGSWAMRKPLPEAWTVDFDDVQMRVRLTPYKHTGVFPEQQENWRWIRGRVKEKAAVLNLFAYSGGATVAAAKAGAVVTHVDASRPAIGWAKENAALNGLPGDRVRWMLDDATAFVARERRRGKKYDGIILDPPAFGHSPTGKTWRVERDLVPLLEDCRALLSERPAFLVLNGYARNDTPESFRRSLSGIFRGKVEARELVLKAVDGRELSTGVVARCSFG